MNIAQRLVAWQKKLFKEKFGHSHAGHVRTGCSAKGSACARCELEPSSSREIYLGTRMRVMLAQDSQRGHGAARALRVGAQQQRLGGLAQARDERVLMQEAHLALGGVHVHIHMRPRQPQVLRGTRRARLVPDLH